MSSETQHDWISALVDGQLSGQELQDARCKLAEDAEAQKLFEQLQSIRADLQAMPELKLGTEFTNRVMQQIGKAQTSQAISPQLAVKPKATHWRMTIGIFSGVAALLLIGLVIFINRQRENNVANHSLNKQKPAPGVDPYDKTGERSKVMPLTRGSDRADQFGVDAGQIESSAGLPNEESAMVSDTKTFQSDLLRKDLADSDADFQRGQEKSANRSNDGAQPSFAEAAPQPTGAASESLREADQPTEVIVAFARLKLGANAEEFERSLKLSQIEIAETEYDVAEAKAAKKEGEEFRRDKNSGDGEAQDATKDRALGPDHANVLVIEGPSDAVESALGRWVQRGELQIASNADEFSSLGANGFMQDMPEGQKGEGLAAGFGGGADLAPLADDQRQGKRGRFADKDEKRELAETENLKLNEEATEKGGEVAGLKLGDAKQSLQTGKSDLAAEADQEDGRLPSNGLTLRHLQYGTAEYDDLQQKVAAVRKREAAGKDVEDAQELSKKVQATDEAEILPGKTRNQSAGDSEAPADKLDHSLTEEKLHRKPQMVRLYILINPHDAVPANAEAAQESPDGK